MKKVYSILMVAVLMLSFAACGSSTTGEEPSSSEQKSTTQSSAPAEKSNTQSDSSASVKAGAESLVVYFSWSGNTENVAKSVQTQTNSDIFEIIPVTPYSDDYDTVVDFAQEEQKNNARPAISGGIDNIENYDVIYVGYPNWWGDMPMILYTFFDTYDLSGKTVAPFCTSGGSGLSNTVNEIKDLEPNANITDGLHIRDNASGGPDDAVGEWLDDIGLVK